MLLKLFHSICFDFGSSRNYRRLARFLYGEFVFTIRLSDGRFVLHNGSNYLSRDFVIDFIRKNHRKNYSICHYVMYWDGNYVLCSILKHVPLKCVQFELF